MSKAYHHIHSSVPYKIVKNKISWFVHPLSVNTIRNKVFLGKAQDSLSFPKKAIVSTHDRRLSQTASA
ncbi:hypothetical protein EO946_09250 [Bacillus spizizenii ATCC 6633 = JCM 2499]|nr:hypothetical protein BIS30_19590 [Bacillus spizizenii]MDR4201855.1 hypothetical protein [Bacillus spizizenii ATCC 6633 = JCM 2499]QCJ17048.1 hypothetical protein FA024_07730 [Bacillus subtilis]MBE0173021.1 hypothetical protein [Bacillus spizizenii]QCY17272.1 hypothetical protein EO946_09250 [Bacillus spizizenii ATCC 6633 = JCM 2499]